MRNVEVLEDNRTTVDDIAIDERVILFYLARRLRMDGEDYVEKLRRIGRDLLGPMPVEIRIFCSILYQRFTRSGSRKLCKMYCDHPELDLMV